MSDLAELRERLAKRLTDEQLAEWDAHAKRGYGRDSIYPAVRALVAEVRRLYAALSKGSPDV